MVGDRTGPDQQSPDAGPPGLIGPNAVTRIAEVLQRDQGVETMRAVLTSARLSHYLASMPKHMIDEREVISLHAALRARFRIDQAKRVGWEAGLRTADYLLAHRIPRPVRWLLRLLPSELSSRILVRAIARHAWTFAGSGTFRVEPGKPLRLIVVGGPISKGCQANQPVCDFYAATFQRLYSELVNPKTTVVETACEATGAPACIFELRF
jgi:divinyl protochlorophyllide a 8-vinyl-reductase